MPSSSTGRFAAVDFIKAIAIVAVVCTHAGFDAWNPLFTPADRWVRLTLASFHVPSFIFVSGFLYYSSAPIPLAIVGQRLLRLVPPYLVASVVMQVAGISGATSLRGALFQLATASALGIYYFVAILVAYTLLTWPMSRLSQRALHMLLIGLGTYGLLSTIHPWLMPVEVWFWGLRDPFHSFGYFLAGWLARFWVPRARSFWDENVALIAAVCVGGIVVYVAGNIGDMPTVLVAVYRALYTFSVLGLIASLTGSSSVPTPVRFISEATYPIYLYHLLFITWALPFTKTWHPVVRDVTLVAIGLSGSLGLVWTVRQILGPRARPLLGA